MKHSGQISSAGGERDSKSDANFKAVETLITVPGNFTGNEPPEIKSLDPSTGPADHVYLRPSCVSSEILPTVCWQLVNQPHLKVALLLWVMMDAGWFCVQFTSLSVGHSQADSGDGGIGHIAVKL